MTRRLTALAPALCLALLLTACGGGDSSGDEAADTPTEATSAASPEETASEPPAETPSETPTDTPTETDPAAPSPGETEFFALLDQVVKDFSRFERAFRSAVAADDLRELKAVIREGRLGFFEFDAALRDLGLTPEQQPALNALLESVGSLIADLDAAGEQRSVQAVRAAVNDIDVEEFTAAFTELAAVVG
jgi:hypothetical protein